MEQEKDGKGEWEGKADLDKEERETDSKTEKNGK